MPNAKSTTWFDAHLDLAYLAETGRDMHAAPDFSPGRHRPAAVTLPALRAAGVASVLATIFTEPVDPADPSAETGAFAYPSPSADTNPAWTAGQRQLRLYQAWHDAGVITIPGRRAPEHPSPDAAESPTTAHILMENADPIEHPGQLEEWHAAGVTALGLAWARASRYAAGNATPAGQDTGLTPAGRDLVKEADRLGVTLDLSHLSDRAARDLLEITDSTVIASHSNARAIIDRFGEQHTNNQRHLPDDIIKEVARRGDVIGINLFAPFLDPNYTTGHTAPKRRSAPKQTRPPISTVLDHITHITGLAGAHTAVGLGSDMDGGFTANDLPAGLSGHAELGTITDAMQAAGHTDDAINAFTHQNWQRLFPA